MGSRTIGRARGTALFPSLEAPFVGEDGRKGQVPLTALAMLRGGYRGGQALALPNRSSPLTHLKTFPGGFAGCATVGWGGWTGGWMDGRMDGRMGQALLITTAPSSGDTGRRPPPGFHSFPCSVPSSQTRQF